MILLCSCDSSKFQKERCNSYCHGDFSDCNLRVRASEEKKSYCVHALATEQLFESASEICHQQDSDESVDIICTDPLLVVVYDGSECGLICSRQSTRLYCDLCHDHCQHVTQFLNWCEVNDIYIDQDAESIEEQQFTCLSSQLIPYPLPTELQSIHDAHECGEWKFPKELVPNYNETLKCEHGHKFSSDDPVLNSWISTKDVIIHKESVSIHDSQRHCFYRPTMGDCDCKQEYDGRDHLLLNLDGKHLFYYGLLFTYLHIMLEGKNPLIAFHRSMQQTFSALSKSRPVGIKHLRQAWNCFARLLDINYQECFLCPQCGRTPKTIVCDGTLIGFRKDFLSRLSVQETKSTDSIQCVTVRHSERVLLKTVKSRELLLQYSGYTKDRKCVKSPKHLTLPQFNSMMKLMRAEGAGALAGVIDQLYKETGTTVAPHAYREFFSELARNTAICGMIQIAGKADVIEVIDKVISGIDVRQAGQKKEFALLQKSAPVIAVFLNKLTLAEPIPLSVCNLLKLLRDLCLAPYKVSAPNNFLSPPDEDYFSCFPSLPLVRRVRNYAADLKLHKEDRDSCRKFSSSHPVLTPGIFTLFCSHGVCYGFQILKQHESPRHPFELILTRFHSMPEYIIYDNSCKLHQYVLNREPVMFQNTTFLVDRFHWRGHTGCSSGYNMDIYQQEYLASLNSQINEQANAGLQKIKGHIAYMKAPNFKFHIKLFLACKNLKICRKFQ